MGASLLAPLKPEIWRKNAQVVEVNVAGGLPSASSGTDRWHHLISAASSGHETLQARLTKILDRSQIFDRHPLHLLFVFGRIPPSRYADEEGSMQPRLIFGEGKS